MDATRESLAVERELEIDARVETVWTLLTDPADAVRWMGVAAEFDLRPGGAYRVTVLPGNVASGVFVEIDEPHRLVYTWGWEEGASTVPPGSTTVEFELEANGEGTLLRFRHTDLPSEAAAQSHAHGWEHYLARLQQAAAGIDPGRDPWLDGGMS